MGKRIAAWALGLIVIAALGFYLIYIPMEVARAQRQPLETTPASVGLAYKDVSFPTKGGELTIRGWWMPAPRPRAVLIFVHGANATREDTHTRGLAISKFLVGQNISVLAPDLRNHGMSDATANGRLTLGWDEANDAIGAIDYATTQAPGLPVYLMGVSMGGATSIYAAARDKRVAKLVLIDPVLNSHVTTLKALHAILKWPSWSLGPVAWSAETFFAGDPAHHVPLKTAETLKLPILLIEDDGDLVCPPEIAYGFAKDKPNVTLWVAHDPGAENPEIKRAGGWGGHASAYMFRPEEMQTQLMAFLGEVMRAETLIKLGGIAAILGGAMRFGEPLLKAVFTGNALLLSYFAIDVFLLLGLVGWYGWRAEKLGVAGLVGFLSGVVGILVIRSAALFAPQGYVIGATLLLIGLVVMNTPALIRREGPICPPLLWLIAFVCGLGSLAYAPLAFVAGTVFGIGYIFAGISLLRA